MSAYRPNELSLPRLQMYFRTAIPSPCQSPLTALIYRAKMICGQLANKVRWSLLDLSVLLFIFRAARIRIEGEQLERFWLLGQDRSSCWREDQEAVYSSVQVSCPDDQKEQREIVDCPRERGSCWTCFHKFHSQGCILLIAVVFLMPTRCFVLDYCIYKLVDK